MITCKINIYHIRPVLVIFQIKITDFTSQKIKNMLLTTISETSNNTNSLDGDNSYNGEMFDKEDIALFNSDDYEEESEYEEEDNALTLQDG